MQTLDASIEALLFASPRPLSLKRLAGLCGAEVSAVEEAVGRLATHYDERGGGLRLLRHEQDVQFVTSNDTAVLVRQFIKDETTGELTKPALETLSIIAYRGPITKLDLEKIRGVNCALILRNLMMRGLVEAKEDKRRLTTYYAVSTEFVRHLGLAHITELPRYDELHRPEVVERIVAENDPTTQPPTTA